MYHSKQDEEANGYLLRIGDVASQDDLSLVSKGKEPARVKPETGKVPFGIKFKPELEVDSGSDCIYSLKYDSSSDGTADSSGTSDGDSSSGDQSSKKKKKPKIAPPRPEVAVEPEPEDEDMPHHEPPVPPLFERKKKGENTVVFDGVEFTELFTRERVLHGYTLICSRGHIDTDKPKLICKRDCTFGTANPMTPDECRQRLRVWNARGAECHGPTARSDHKGKGGQLLIEYAGVVGT